MQTTHPVGQPLLVIVGARGLDGAHRQVGGKGPANEVGHGGRKAEQVEKDEGHESDCETEDTVGLGNLGPCLEVVQEAVLGELGTSV